MKCLKQLTRGRSVREVPFSLACGQGRIAGRRFSPLFEWREATTGNTSVFGDYIFVCFTALMGCPSQLTRSGGQGSTVNILIFFFFLTLWAS